MSEQNSNFFIDLIEYYNNKASNIQSQAQEASVHELDQFSPQYKIIGTTIEKLHQCHAYLRIRFDGVT